MELRLENAVTRRDELTLYAMQMSSGSMFARRWQISLLVGCIIFANAALLGIGTRYQSTGRQDEVLLVAQSLAFSQLGLLSIWLALGRTHVVWRTAATAAGIGFWAWVSTSGNYVVIPWTVFVTANVFAATAVLFVLRFAGFYVTITASCSSELSEIKPVAQNATSIQARGRRAIGFRQITIGGSLLAMVVFTLAFSWLRFLGDRLSIADAAHFVSPLLLSIYVCFAVLTALVAWAALGAHRFLPRLAEFIGTTIAAGWFVYWARQNFRSDYDLFQPLIYYSYWVYIYSTLMFVALLLVRTAGYRASWGDMESA